MGGVDRARWRVFTSAANVTGSDGPGTDAAQGGEHETWPRHLTFCMAVPVVRTSQDQHADAAPSSRRPAGRFRLSVRDGPALPRQRRTATRSPRRRSCASGYSAAGFAGLQPW